MKQYFLVIVFCVIAFAGMAEQAHAQDVYVCDFSEHEVYLDTGSIMGSPFQIIVFNGIKFVQDEKTKHIATAKFYLEGNVWYGNLLIDNMPSQGDYPVVYDELTLAIFQTARQYM